MEMQIGYARNTREEKRLLAAGLKPAAIYLEGRGNETLGRIKLRPGEVLLTIGGLRALGDSRRMMALVARLIHDQGAVVQDVDTGERSDQRGVEMLDSALSRLHGERTMPDPKVASAMAARSAAAKVKGRMPVNEARKVWGNNPMLGNGEVLALMPGWSEGSAYLTFGKRGIPTGRPAKRKSK